MVTKLQIGNIDRRPLAANVSALIAEAPGQDLEPTLRSLDAQTLAPGEVLAVKRFDSLGLIARSEYVLCLHAGDFADPTLLEKSLFVLDRNRADVSLTPVAAKAPADQRTSAIAMVRKRRFSKIRDLITPGKAPGDLRATMVARGLSPALLAEPLLFRGCEDAPAREARSFGGKVIVITTGCLPGRNSLFLEPLCAALKERGFIVLVLAEEAPQPELSRSLREHAAGVFNLCSFLDERSRLNFLIDVVRRHSARSIWNIGPSFARTAIVSLRQCFPNLGLMDLLCGPVPTNYTEISYVLDHIFSENEELREALLLRGESPDRLSVLRWSDVEAACDWLRTRLEPTRYTSVFSIAGGLSIEQQTQPRRPAISPAVRMLMMFLSPPRLRANVQNAMLLRRIRRRKGGEELLAEYFDPADYLRRYPDVAESGISPLLHYTYCGFTENRDPGTRFMTGEYLKAHRDVARAGLNPLLHYLIFGSRENRSVAARVTPDKGAERS